MRVVITIAIVVSLGCGRLRFEERSGGDGDDGDSIGWGDSGVLPVTCTSPQPEVCNGIDDDCDGVVDEGCPCAAIATSFTESPGYYTEISLWTGAQLIQLGTDSATVGLWPVNATGTVQAYVPIFSGAAGTAGYSAAAWSGSVLAVAYAHDSNILELARFDPASKQLTHMQIDTTYPGANPQVTWAGDHFVVAWQAAPDDVIVRDISTAGTPLGPERVLASGTGGILGSIEVGTAGTVFCIRDSNDGTGRITLVDPSGTPHTQPIPLGVGMFCRLLPIPGGYVAYYGQPSTSPAPLVFLDGSGNVTSTVMLPVGLSAYVTVAIERVSTGLWVMASRLPGLYTHAIDEIALDPRGNVISAPVQQDQIGAYLWSPPQLVTTAGQKTATWSTNAGGAPSTYQLTRTCN